MAAVRDNAWVGIDVGKTHHWVCAVDADGKTLLSVKVANDEAGILSLIAAASALAQQLTWAVDIIGAPSRCCSRCWRMPASRCVTRRDV